MADGLETIGPEWHDEFQDLPTMISLPEANEDYAYAAMRLMSWFPVINVRGATYFPEDITDELLQSLLGVQANLEHDKARVVGSIVGYLKTDDGVDVAVRIDREQADLQNLDINAMREDGYFSRCSLELSRDPDKSQHIVYDDGMNILRSIPTRAARQQGIRRTTAIDPYRLQGNRVAERLVPKRFTGLGLVHNPADKTSELYSVAASADSEETLKITLDDLFLEVLPEDLAEINAIYEMDETAEIASAGKKPLTPGSNHADPGWQKDGRPRYPLDTPGHVRSAAKFFGNPKYRAKYSAAHIKAIDAKIAAAKKRYGIGETEKADASTSLIGDLFMSDADLVLLNKKVTDLETAVAKLTAEKETASADNVTLKADNEKLTVRVAELEKELASANDELGTLRKEKEVAAADKRLQEILDELHAIHPIAEDERETLKEKAAAYCTSDGVVHPITELTQARTIKALEAKLAAKEPTADEKAAAEKAAAEKAAADKAQADAEAKAAADAKSAEELKAKAEAAAKEKEKASAFDPGETPEFTGVLATEYRGYKVEDLVALY